MFPHHSVLLPSDEAKIKELSGKKGNNPISCQHPTRKNLTRYYYFRLQICCINLGKKLFFRMKPTQMV